MFYARAKQTFFTPGSEYELNLPSSILSPFHVADSPPYPEPEAFIPIEIETRRMLDDSLRRFVQGQLSNMGNNRIICGIIVGILFCILGATPPLTVNFVLGHDRWERLSAFPGLWFGLWLIVASLNGVCLGIYLFGDLRQLRQFELARPIISKPVALSGNRPARPGILIPASTNESLPLYRQPKRPTNRELHRVSSNLSEVTGETARTPTTQRSIFDGHIQISQAYYDADEIDESAMYHDDEDGDFVENAGESYRLPDLSREDEDHTREALRSFFSRDQDGNAYVSGEPGASGTIYTATAKFIHPFELNDSNEDLGAAFERPDQHQRVDNFDFDLLPKRIRPRRSQNRSEDSRALTSPATAASKIAPFSVDHVARSDASFTSVPSSPTSLLSPTTVSSPQPGLFFPPPLKLRAPDPRAPPLAPPPTNVIARFQEKCSIKRHRLQPGYLESDNGYSDHDPTRPHSSSNYWSQSQKKDDDDNSLNASVSRASSVSTRGESNLDGATSKEEKVRLRFKKISAVPPFKAPLTKILSPLIQRGQWEIVIRTGFIGFVLAWAIVGGLLAAPVTSRR